jgi:hypothetical protein
MKKNTTQHSKKKNKGCAITTGMAMDVPFALHGKISIGDRNIPKPDI